MIFKVNTMQNSSVPSSKDSQDFGIASKYYNDARSVCAISIPRLCAICCHDYLGKTTFDNIFDSEIIQI